jgi:hypothetical protein
MKKIGFFIILLLLVLAACEPSDNAVEIAQAQSVIEAAQIASQGLSDVGRGQTLILLLLTLVLIILVCLAAYIVIQRQLWKHTRVQQMDAGRWMSGPNARWKRVDSPDPYQQLLLQQQMLLPQLLQQNQTETEENDQPQLPDGWWG